MSKRITKEEFATRTAEMEQLRSEGLKLREIGEKYDLTRERVRQIIGNTGRPKGRPRKEVAVE